MSGKLLQAVMSDADLKNPHKAVLVALAWLTKEGETSCSWPIEDISAWAGESVRTTKRAMADMRQWDWIKVNRPRGEDGKMDLNVYQITRKARGHLGPWTRGQNCQKPGAKPGATLAPFLKEDKEEEEKEEPPYPLKGDVSVFRLESENGTEPPKRSRRPTEEEVVSYVTSVLHLPAEDGRALSDSWKTNGFKLKTGRPVQDWQAAARNWNRNSWFPSQKNAGRRAKDDDPRSCL